MRVPVSRFSGTMINAVDFSHRTGAYQNASTQTEDEIEDKGNQEEVGKEEDEEKINDDEEKKGESDEETERGKEEDIDEEKKGEHNE